MRLKKVQCNYQMEDYYDESCDFISFGRYNSKIVTILMESIKPQGITKIVRGIMRPQNICCGNCIMM
jgi:hypothetical protein